METLLNLLIEAESKAERAEIAEAIRSLSATDDYLFTGILLAAVAAMAALGAATWLAFKVRKIEQHNAA
jgi:hypothetical protein